MLTDEQLEQLEAENVEAREAIKVGEAFKRLLENEDYKLVFSKGYVEDYAKELGYAISTNTGAYNEAELVSALKGINGFIQYGFKVAGNHMAAEQTISDNARFIAEQGEE